MNDTPQTPFAFVPAQPKGQTVPEAVNAALQAAAGPAEKQKRTRRTKEQIAIEQRAMNASKEIDAFDVFDSVFEILDPLPKPVRDRIMSTLNRIYA